MCKRTLVTLAIIAGIGFGVGAIMYCTLLMQLGEIFVAQAAISACRSGILAASLAALVAQLGGGFRELNEQDR
jgi:hypothetical protein